jgi:hypothetical protein
MTAHILDHFIFTSRRLSKEIKWGVFGGCVAAVVGTFLWFKGVAFGIEGPIKEHWGLLWRKVSSHDTEHGPKSQFPCQQSWNIYEQH